MTKWGYIYALIMSDNVNSVNGRDVREYQKFSKGVRGRPTVSEFLEKSGLDGWEVVGLCPASDGASYWRLILKRPIF